MTNDGRSQKISQVPCLTDDDLYSYVSGQGNAELLNQTETHLAECSSCRQNLAQILEILHPASEEDISSHEPSKDELEQTIAVIRGISQKEHGGGNKIPQWVRWSVAAAAVLGLFTVSFLAINSLVVEHRSESFFSQAKAEIELSYTGTSPSNLRLSLPFHQTATMRGGSGQETLRTAENLLFQALALRKDMVNAHLGLGLIYLNESQFGRAQNEFRRVLEIQKNQVQALVGDGVAQYEQAIQSADPLQRTELLGNALKSFDAVLRIDPKSIEARYDKIWALFESGLHDDALQEIETYLASDPDSIWAEELKGLRTRMRATQSSAVERDVSQAARNRDAASLAALSRQASYRMPNAIRSALLRSLAEDTLAAKNDDPAPGDWSWAAETIEAAYSASTRDHSLRSFIEFYIGLSPPDRKTKKSLDQQYQHLVDLYHSGKFDLALQNSKPLELQYKRIKDFWQLAYLHHLIGDTLYLGKADFRAAEMEFRKMYDISKRLNAPFLQALALRALALIYGEQRKFDESIASGNAAKTLAEKYRFDSLIASACITIGDQYRLLGRFQPALQEYATALRHASHLFEELRITQAFENSGVVFAHLGQFDSAESSYQLAIQWLDAYLKNKGKTPRLINRRFNLLFRQGELALQAADLGKAETIFADNLKDAPSGMREFEARNRIALTEVYLRTRRLSEAESTLSPALALCASGQYPEVEWQAKFTKGRLLEEQKHIDEALLSYQDSIQALERMRQNVKPGDLRQSFFVQRYDPFKALATLLFNTGGNRQELLEIVDRSKAATLKENMRGLYSMATYPTDSPSGKSHAYTTLEYFFARDQLLILLTTPDHIEVFARNLSAAEMSRQLQRFLQSVKLNDYKSFQEMSRQLYDELVAPVDSYVFSAKSTEPFVILPDGPLYLLPFAGLQDKSGRFLIEKAPLVFAPSRSIFRHCLLTAREPSASKNWQIVLLDGSGGLLHAGEELAYVSKLYGQKALVIGAKQLPIPARLLARTKFLHFSGHAMIRQNQPLLVLQKFPKEIYLDCQTIHDWTMPQAELVNLAGCNTAIGPIAEGEAPWGLVPAFLDAGAQSIVASLLEVDDASTEELSCRFYDLLHSGLSKAKALQLAQIDLLSSARTNRTNKPQSWLPYALIGSPQ
jgi:CHAT domain-containing protein